MNLILLEPEALRDGRVELTGASARHAVTVLHVQVGQDVRIGILNGPRGMGRVMRDGTLLARPGSQLGKLTFDQWLATL